MEVPTNEQIDWVLGKIKEYERLNKKMEKYDLIDEYENPTLSEALGRKRVIMQVNILKETRDTTNGWEFKRRFWAKPGPKGWKPTEPTDEEFYASNVSLETWLKEESDRDSWSEFMKNEMSGLD
jgi:hypothetical protein